MTRHHLTDTQARRVQWGEDAAGQPGQPGHVGHLDYRKVRAAGVTGVHRLPRRSRRHDRDVLEPGGQGGSDRAVAAVGDRDRLDTRIRPRPAHPLGDSVRDLRGRQRPLELVRCDQHSGHCRV